MRVTVWPDKFVRGWERGSNPPVDSRGEALVNHPVVEVHEALTAYYSTDAHFVPYRIPGLPVAPRVNAGGLVELNRTGLDVVFDLVVVDLDAPDHGHQLSEHEVHAWVAEQLRKLMSVPELWSGCAWYATRGGARLLWTLPEGTSRVDYLKTLTRLRHALLSADLEGVDRLIDWQRCYRLPFVLRDGEPQRHPMNLDNLGPLPELEEAPDEADGDIWDGFNEAGVGPFTLPDRIPLGVQDDVLTQYAGQLRRQGLPPEVIVDALALVYANRCEPPPPGRRPHTMQDFRRIARSVSRYEPVPFDVRRAGLESLIIRAGDLSELIERSARLLSRSEALFARGGALVHVVRDEYKRPLVLLTKTPVVRAELGRVAAWLKMAKTKKSERDDPESAWFGREFKEIPADPPKDSAEAVAALGDWPGIRELRGVSSTPLIRPDGTILSNEGYDEQTGVLLMTQPGFVWPIPGDAPTRAQAEHALAELRSLLTDFPFGKPEHESAALAAMLTAVGRHSVDGPAPLFLIDATTPGSGKGLLAHVVSTLSTGSSAAIMPQTEDIETEKRVTALLMGGAQVILLDNIDRPLGGAVLDAVLTSDTWQGRILGASRMVSVPNRVCWLATGNNIAVKGDLVRRCLRVYLEPDDGAPERRTDFSHPDLLDHVRRHRGRYVGAALTVLRAWHVHRQQLTMPAFGGFGEWSGNVRAALVWLGMADPLKTQDELLQQADTSREAMVTLLQAWWAIFAQRPVTVRALMENVQLQSFGASTGSPISTHTEALREALVELAGDARGEVNPKRLGWVLRRNAMRWFGPLRLERAEQRSSAGTAWKVRPRLELAD